MNLAASFGVLFALLFAIVLMSLFEIEGDLDELHLAVAAECGR